MSATAKTLLVVVVATAAFCWLVLKKKSGLQEKAAGQEVKIVDVPPGQTEQIKAATTKSQGRPRPMLDQLKKG